jgi:hypothetical protein
MEQRDTFENGMGIHETQSSRLKFKTNRCLIACSILFLSQDVSAARQENREPWPP